MNVSTRQRRIAELAKRSPEMSFHSLSHHMDVEWLREAYGRLKKSSAPGSDGVTGEAYGQNLKENLSSLLDRAKSWRYIAPAVRRARLPKPDAPQETRPRGMIRPSRVLVSSGFSRMNPPFKSTTWRVEP